MLYKVVSFTQDGQISQECDNFAFLYSGEYAKIVGKQQRLSGNGDIHGYLKVSCHGQKIYLKYHSWNGVKADEVQLSYFNRARLGLPNAGKASVEISQSCWFAYYWCNGDNGVKCPFRIGVVGFVLAIISFITQIYEFFHVSVCNLL